MSSHLIRNVQTPPNSQLQYRINGSPNSFPNASQMANMPGTSRNFDAYRDYHQDSPGFFQGGNSFPPPSLNEAYDSASASNSKPQDPLATACIGVADLITKMAITHPCTVLRRQCQVHQFARSLHLTPFTLAPVICNMIASEGVLTLWKGAVGSCVLWAMSTASEILIADIFGLPRTVVKYGSTEKFWRHVALKASTFVTMTPFFVSSFIETVRSETGLGGDDIRVMDVITNGVNRLRFDFFGPRDNSKRFTLFSLAIPTSIYHTAHYFVAEGTYDGLHKLAQRYVSRKPAAERTLFHQFLPQVFATITSQGIADIICYPMETVMHRLYIQGTRTLIDNLDNGVSAISITAKYAGFYDCLRSIVQREGFCALYSGIGALTLQYLLHFSFLRFVRWLFEYGTRTMSAQLQNPPPVVSPPTPAPSIFSGSQHPPGPSIFMSQSATSPKPSPYPTFGQTSATAFGHSSPSTFGHSSPPHIGSPPSASLFGDRPMGSLRLSTGFEPRDSKTFGGTDFHTE